MIKLGSHEKSRREHTGGSELGLFKGRSKACCLGWGQGESGRVGSCCQIVCGSGKGLVFYSHQMRRPKSVLNREVMGSNHFYNELKVGAWELELKINQESLVWSRLRWLELGPGCWQL